MKYCIICSTKLKDSRGKRCRPCDKIWRKTAFSGKRNPFYGKTHTIETRRKISISHVGTIPYNSLVSKIYKDKLIDLYINKKMTEFQIAEMLNCSQQVISEYLRKCNIECISMSLRTKERLKNPRNHPNWQGGKSFEIYPIGWNNELKQQIRQRDNYKCQLCGIDQEECYRKLDVHHIDYNKENLEESNLISLCMSCHRKTNYNREYWKNRFKNANTITI